MNGCKYCPTFDLRYNSIYPGWYYQLKKFKLLVTGKSIQHRTMSLSMPILVNTWCTALANNLTGPHAVICGAINSFVLIKILSKINYHCI
jgi:hypothetical protein